MIQKNWIHGLVLFVALVFPFRAQGTTTISPPFPFFADHGFFRQDMDSPLDDHASKSDSFLKEVRIGKCPLPPPPPSTLDISGFYKKSDPNRATIDKNAYKTYEAQMAGIRLFESRLMSLANASIRSKGKSDGTYARCALHWMLSWERSGVYVGKTSKQGRFVRAWGLTVLSNAYFQIHQSLEPDSGEMKELETWLETIAQAIMADFGKGGVLEESKNNHLYWAAWALVSTGFALNNQDYYKWGTEKVRHALSHDVQPDGTLPLELARGKKALQYHNFSLTPLLLVAQTLRTNKDSLTSEETRGLHRLARLTFSGILDPSVFEKLTAEKQESPRNIADSHFAWIEIYNALWPNARMTAFIETRRPLKSTRAGGDVTYLFSQ